MVLARARSLVLAVVAVGRGVVPRAWRRTAPSLIGRLGLLCIIGFLGVLWPGTAVAHGPCGCLFPQVGEIGAQVRARSPAYRIVFNPTPQDYGRAMADTGYASAYEPRARTRTVLSRPLADPVRRASFRIPPVPPGVYLLLIFDGTEGGSHSTWDYFHVLGAAATAPERPARAASTDVRRGDGDAPLALLAAGFLGGGVLGSGARSLVLRKRRAEQ